MHHLTKMFAYVAIAIATERQDGTVRKKCGPRQETRILKHHLGRGE